MYTLIFLISLIYIGYNSYHAAKGTLPLWIEKRLYNLRNDPSFKDLNNKRWDTPIGALSKTFSLSILFTSFIVLTYLIGWSNVSKNDNLYALVFLGAVAITFFMQRNFGRRANYYRAYQS